MFRTLLLSVLLLAGLSACNKTDDAAPSNNNNNNNNGGGNNGGGNQPQDTFTVYTIQPGNFYCDQSSLKACNLSVLKFQAILDSSCIYTSTNPVNQADINKLYGFADSTFHHQNSARFGWNWMNGQMHIHAYCYADSVRAYKELGTVALNTPFDCSIAVLPGQYIFTFNGKKDTMLRGVQDTVARGYMLQPYFGGDEPAPHLVKIKIREVK